MAAGTVIFVGISSEKGTFFEGEINLTQPFNSASLCISYDEIDGNEIISAITYNDEDIDNNGGSTNGKSSDFGFYIAGSQQDGKFECYKDMDDITYELTEWFPASINPVRNGKYEAEIETGQQYQVEWTGQDWINDWNDEKVVIKKWRGIAIDPDNE